HLEQATRWDSFGLADEKTTRIFRDVIRDTMQHRGIRNPVYRLRTPDERAHQRALVAELRAALTEGKDPAQALETAARRWSEIDRPLGAKAREQYWVSQGLIPPRR